MKLFVEALNASSIILVSEPPIDLSAKGAEERNPSEDPVFVNNKGLSEEEELGWGNGGAGGGESLRK